MVYGLASSRKEMMAMENVGKKFGGNILPSGKGKVFDLARRLRRAQQIAQIGYWELSLVDDQHFWSEEIIELLGSKKNGKKFDEKFLFRHIHPADTIILKEGLRKASKEADTLQVVQFRIIQDDTKELRNVEAKFTGATENGSVIVRIEGTLQNIDERVTAIDALAESKIRLQKAFEVANLGSYKYFVNEDELEWSEEAIKVLQIDENNIPTTISDFMKLVHPDDVKNLVSSPAEIKTNIETESEYRIRTSHGYKWIYSKRVRFYENNGEVDYIIGVIQDINIRKREEEKKEADNTKLRAGAELAKLGYWEYKYDRNLFIFNDQFYKLFRTSIGQVGSYEMTPEEYVDWVYIEENGALTSQELLAYMKNRDASPFRESQFKVRFGNGEEGYVAVKSEPVFDDQGVLVGRIGVNQDITDQVLEEQKKEKVAYHLQTGADLAQLGYWEFDFNSGKYLFNDQFYKILKSSVAKIGSYEMTAKEYMDTFFPKDREGEELKERFLNLMSSKESSPVLEVEHKIIFGNGEEGYIAVRSTPIKNEDGKLIRILGAVQDVTKKVLEQQKLEKTANKLQTGAELALLGYWELDYRTFMYTFNDQFYKVFKTTVEAQGGYQLTPQEYVDRFFREEEHGIQKEEVLNLLLTAQLDGYRETNHAVTFGDGSQGYVTVVSKPIFDTEGNIIGRFGAIQDVTKSRENQHELQNALKEIEEHLHQFRVGGDLAKVGHWSMDLKENRYTFSDQFYKVYRTSVEEIGGYTMSPEEYMSRFNITVNVNELKDSDVGYFSTNKVTEPIRHFHKLTFGNGEDGYVAVLSVPIYNEEGKVIKLLGANQDVTDQENRKHELEKALNEKVTLLSEVHHRVKNNLALISGLLQLQTMYSDLPPLNSKLQQSTTRIKSIALVHELLYQSSHLTSINIKEYLTKVIPTLEATYAPIGINIDLTIESDDHEININQAVPVGLLLNELITNSYQYAFNNRSRGTINISLYTIGDMLHMCYWDDGVGIPDFTGIERATSLGFTLIKSQLDQLSAHYKFDTKSGFKLEFSFSESDRGSHSNV